VNCCSYLERFLSKLLTTKDLLANFTSQFSEIVNNVGVAGEILRWNLKGAVVVFKYVTCGGTITTATADMSVKTALNVTTLNS